ncbi:MAG: isoprenylcysteine carboxylmethyltransferase family protein [Bacteroidetes bacterium]|nr:isoprenylcysteine carboxylmethyltransferase family protein [Bacteroidota bacterium]
MNDFLRYYLPIFYALVLLFAFVIPSYRTYKSTGINPITFGKEPNAHNYIGNVMKVLLAALFVVILMYSFGNIYQFTIPIPYLQNLNIHFVGLILIHISLIWIIIAQVQMSNSWRIGIDEQNNTDLVTNGLFSISRNPVFLGMIICVAGLFLVIANAISFCILVTTYIVIQIQIRLEEEFLKKQHGEQYISYQSKTRRL